MWMIYLFLTLGGKHHIHLFAVEFGHRLHLGEFVKVSSKAQQENLPLLLENDTAAAEKDISLHLGALLQEILGMLELEVVVVVIGLRAETYLLDYNFNLIGLQLLGLFLLLIEELLVISDATYGGLGFGRNFDEVELHFVGKFQRLADG